MYSMYLSILASVSLEGLSPSLIVKATCDYLPLSPTLPHHHTDILGKYLAQEPAEHGEGGREVGREGGRERERERIHAE